jgi:hypothetical protein
VSWWHRVGQRVKIARPADGVNSGAEGVIISLGQPAGWARPANCLVSFDKEISTLYGPMRDGGIDLDRLEPIMPEGNKVVSWSECLWMPPHLREQDALLLEYARLTEKARDL